MGIQITCRVPGIMLPGLLAAMVCCGQEEPAPSAPAAVAYDRARYDLIVERSPFGADPLADAEEARNAAAATALEKEYRLCFLLKSQAGEIRAGFQNLKAKKGDPKSVILGVGESYGGMKLVDINLEDSLATIQYQGRSVEFELSKGSAPAAPAAPAVAAAQRASNAAQQNPQRRFGSGFRRNTPPAEEAQVEQPQPEVPQLTPEQVAQQQAEVQENLRQYQMEVIRQGMPPLPIPLTQEMDDQLVSEGVLPPAQ